MAHATTGLKLIQRLRLRAAPGQPDPADLGTAFGLELSMQDAAPATTPGTKRAGDRSWWRRFAVRRSVGAA